MSKLKAQLLEPLLENSNYNVDLYHIDKASYKLAQRQYEEQVKLRKKRKHDKQS
ncbi:MAG: hypothetical protein QQN63_02875 [Nitrosopumilus sp.]